MFACSTAVYGKQMYKPVDNAITNPGHHKLNVDRKVPVARNPTTQNPIVHKK
jgi:hypothetical protein